MRMNKDQLLEMAKNNFAADEESLTPEDAVDFALFVLKEMSRREKIVALREHCMVNGHVFHWSTQDYQIGETVLDSSGVTVEGYKTSAQKCHCCDGVLGITYTEGVI
jgi:hypothetical protein